jgi:glycerol-3-phosphate O-acyltransferase / dihydroxyacetone phosphate acyltransferase
MYRLIRGLFTLAVKLFYHGRILGAQIPESGPTILVANHPNGLIDPIMVMAATSRPVRFLAKEPLFKMPVIGWLLRAVNALPIYRASDGANTADNAVTFKAVTEALHAGEVICLFPEGISHDKPEVQPLKTGAARMALIAEATRAFELEINIIPVGLHLRDKVRFRSEAATWIGETITVSTEIQRLYAENERDAARQLTTRIDGGIRAVTVNLNGWEDLPLLELAGRIWTDEHDPVVRLKAMADAERSFHERNPVIIAHLRARLVAFTHDLARFGITLEDLDLKWRFTPTCTFLAKNLSALVLGLPVALLGALLYIVPYQAVRVVTLFNNPEPDVEATVKVLSSMLFFVAWHGVVFGVSWHYLGPYWGLGLGAIGPFMGLYFHYFWERRVEALRQARYLLKLPLRQRLRDALTAERDAIRMAIRELSETRSV